VVTHQCLYRQISGGNDPLTDERRVYRRNLSLLLGQVATNTGIAKVELGVHLREVCDSRKKLELREAIKGLQDAVKSAEDMASCANKDTPEGCKESEIFLDALLLDVLQAQNLRRKSPLGT
jgi:hypothetical protein